MMMMPFPVAFCLMGFFLAIFWPQGPECVPFFYEGNYQEYEENRKVRWGETGPTRIKYRPLPTTL